jgi:peptide/nickel transport system permease protein
MELDEDLDDTPELQTCRSHETSGVKNLQKKTTRYLLAVFFIATLNFMIPRVMPGDPVTNLLGEDSMLSHKHLAELKAELGLDQPLLSQYLKYWKDVLHLKFGFSYHYNAKVSQLIGARLKWTLLLVGPGIILGALLGTCLGAVSGWKNQTTLNKLATALMLLIYSTPPYFFALLVLYLFAFKLELFSLRGFYTTGSVGDIFKHLFLPVMVLTLFVTSRNYMMMQGSVLQEKEKLYALCAKAKGLMGNAILFRHIFKNASLPVVTLVALDFGFILSGALFVEIVFSMNGMGTLIYDAVMSRDYPVLQGIFLIMTIMVVTMNFLADLVYSVIDPRVRTAS